MSDGSATRISKAIYHLGAGERALAAALVRDELSAGPAAGEQWIEVQRLASEMGEVEMAIEAARRFARTAPARLDRVLHYCRELLANGRGDEALAEIRDLPAASRGHPSVLLFLAAAATERGDFGEAEQHYRHALPDAPVQSWFGISLIKTFRAGDADLADMERLLSRLDGANPELQARHSYSLAKACHDCGDFERAWALYERGAALRRRQESWDPALHRKVAGDLIRDFTAEAVQALQPVVEPRRPALFVTGLPRTGTTLVNQMLVSHSQVADGAEFNFLRAALSPTRDYSLDGALRYQRSGAGEDPWGKLAADYFRMLEMRFRTAGLVIDKSPLQSFFMGLLLHMLPEARVIWLRRDPEDTALSCFRTFFSTPISWTWSLAEIGGFFRVEDRLFAHWVGQFPERILPVQYEDLVREPHEWVSRILEFARLPPEPGVLEFHRTQGRVRTASVQQVRQPISTARVGSAAAYSAHMGPFREAYQG